MVVIDTILLTIYYNELITNSTLNVSCKSGSKRPVEVVQYPVKVLQRPAYRTCSA